MITKEQVNYNPFSTTEKLAHAMYDAYCVQVGGKAWDGRPLPTSKEFFEDATKQKQAWGWRAAARKAIDLIFGDTDHGQD